MNTRVEDANELSWLKGDSKEINNVASSPRATKESKDDKTDQEKNYSWLYEDSVDDERSSSTVKSHTKTKDVVKLAKNGVKWKQPMKGGSNNSNNGFPPDDESTEDDSDIFCCCCSSDPVLFSFQCFHFTSGLTGLAAFAANIYTLTKPSITIRDTIVRSYALVFCLLIVIVELDWRYILNKVRFLDHWILRGFFYAFVGFVTCK